MRETVKTVLDMQQRIVDDRVLQVATCIFHLPTYKYVCWKSTVIECMLPDCPAY